MLQLQNAYRWRAELQYALVLTVATAIAAPELTVVVCQRGMCTTLHKYSTGPEQQR
jgi:hypothetical protein